MAQGRDEQGLDALEAGAKAKAAAALQDGKRIGALAFAVDTKRALNANEEALKLAPNDLDARNELDRLKLRMGDLPGAEAAYRAVLAGAGADKSAQAVAFGNLGVIVYTRGDLAGAADYDKRAGAEHRTRPQARPGEQSQKHGRARVAERGIARNNIAQFCPR